MCNIAGYIGNRPAAPILIEMLRKQEFYDGGLATGIATVHEGKLYMRKLPENLDDLIKHTDALDLPGTVGIIHTRPGNNPPDYTHPHLSEDGQLAAVLNGTISQDKFAEQRNRSTQKAADAGYEFIAKYKDCCLNFPEFDGGHVPEGEQIAHLTAMYRKAGYSYTEAFRLAVDDGFTEMVAVMLTTNDPDKIRIARISRPMFALVGDGECFIASCEYAFPEDVRGARFSLPVLNVCEMTRDGITVTKERLISEEVAEPTPKSYELGMKLIKEHLRAAKENGGAHFDNLELILKSHQYELFDNGYTYSQYARLVYDLIYQLDKEGALRGEIRPNPKGTPRRYMWLD